MKADAHIYSSDTALGTGSQAKGLCGKTVTRVHLVRAWDSQMIGFAPEYPTKNMCEKCLELQKTAEGTYLYVIREDKHEVVFND